MGRGRGEDGKRGIGGEVKKCLGYSSIGLKRRKIDLRSAFSPI
jgi:hypothetical protein